MKCDGMRRDGTWFSQLTPTTDTAHRRYNQAPIHTISRTIPGQADDAHRRTRSRRPCQLEKRDRREGERRAAISYVGKRVKRESLLLGGFATRRARELQARTRAGGQWR